ncbi:arachidonate 15-lipoxygenase [Pacificimonas flava]|uniref:Arachidonate 15-lipoxygenase n=2 Tax=Pacificimonas TaxID=1960290 RepID=A0A219B3Q4_9SPHN|nr:MULTISPECIES: lipoxygenase family protein [Pacificimonas]MBZ6377316.1 arachidonate 15-lipoxygenase [Pacificimonas aurantium]OWV32975.1 arachidonate 15-lipoxygenase [Pacificimonas flava]
MRLAPLHPSLPQNDDPAQQKAREQQLEKARATYQWTTEIPSLPSVPLATDVPSADKPTLAWLLVVLGYAIEILRNQISILLTMHQHLGTKPSDHVAHAQDRLAAIEASMHEIARRHAVVHAGAGSTLLNEVKEAADWAEHGSHNDLLHSHGQELRGLIDGGIQLIEELTARAGTATLDDFRGLFHNLPLPGMAWLFQEDDQFARMRVAGPNCMLIEQVDVLPDSFPLTEEQYAAVVPGDTLSAALKEKRAFLCDYKELSILVPGVWKDLAKYVYQPIALFALPPGGAELVPVAIQCGQDPDEFPIFTPSVDPAKLWGWQIAKTIVQVADGNYHELVCHLARTHLVIESIAVATHRQLSNQHPIWALLAPHFEGTLFINYDAATSLIAPGGPIDHIFGGTMETSQALAVKGRMTFRFREKMLPNDLKNRGVAKADVLPEYPYRDDALLVWHAIESWAGQYVDIYYDSDEAVTQDTELKAWVDAITADAKVEDFGELSTRDELVKACTMIMFTASAQHAAVNFPQRGVMDFAPSVTGGGWADVPASQRGHSKSDWLAYMPPLPLATQQLNLLFLLGSVHYRPLGDYRSNEFPYPNWFTDPQIIGDEGPLARFQAMLKAADAEIESRNADRRWPYPYLQPSLIPTSINI